MEFNFGHSYVFFSFSEVMFHETFMEKESPIYFERYDPPSNMATPQLAPQGPRGPQGPLASVAVVRLEAVLLALLGVEPVGLKTWSGKDGICDLQIPRILGFWTIFWKFPKQLLVDRLYRPVSGVQARYPRYLSELWNWPSSFLTFQMGQELKSQRASELCFQKNDGFSNQHVT